MPLSALRSASGYTAGKVRPPFGQADERRQAMEVRLVARVRSARFTGVGRRSAASPTSRRAGFPTCRIADFPVGSRLRAGRTKRIGTCDCPLHIERHCGYKPLSENHENE